MIIANFNIWDIIILALVALILIGAFMLARDRKKKGCCGTGECDNNCQCCNMNCREKKIEDDH